MSWVERYKPAAAVRAHLLLAGLMWAVVGAGTNLQPRCGRTCCWPG